MLARHPDLEDEKKFYERFNALHRDPQLVSVLKSFGIDAFRRSSVLEGFEAFIQRHNFKGRRCVEIGTCKGLTAIVLARYFREVVSIDVMPDKERAAIAKHVGATNVRFVTVADNVEKAKAINALTFDAAYVDGDHARDTATDFALVRRGNRVLFHEYWEAQPPVWTLINMLIRRGENVVTEGKLALWTTR